MCSDAARRWMIPALILAAIVCPNGIARADSGPPSPGEGKITLPTTYPYVPTGRSIWIPIDQSPVIQPIAVRNLGYEPAPRPIIYDPLPPALWSGLSTLVAGAAVASFRSIRRRLR